jgi:gliding motility-associated-like protein
MKSVKLALFVAALIIATRVHAVNYYWTGGTGNWSDLNNWATSSGGSTKHSQVPTPDDDVFFDANSFGAAGQSMTINVSNAVCRDFIWGNVKFKPRFAITDPSYALRIYGSLQLNSNMLFDYKGYFVFESTKKSNTIKTANFNIQKMEFKGIGGEWTLQDSLKLYGDINNYALWLNAGHLISNDQTIVVKSVHSYGTNVRTLSLGNSQVHLKDNEGVWRVDNINFYLNPGTSKIHIWYQGWRKNFHHTAYQPKSRFHDIIFHDKYASNPTVGDYLTVNDSTCINNLIFETYVNGMEISGAIVKRIVFNERVDYVNFNNAKIGSVLFKDDARCLGSASIDSLLLTPGKNYRFGANQTQTIGKHIGLLGSCNGNIYLQSDFPGTQTKFIKTNGSVNANYLILQDVDVSGGATFISSNTYDLGNNTGWNITTATSRNLYYIGKQGKWGAPNSWSLSSGGSPTGCIPSPIDNVTFDANAFASTKDTLFLDQTNNRCKSFSWLSTAAGSTIYSKPYQKLEVFGNLLMNGDAINAMMGSVQFDGTTQGNTITSNRFKFTWLDFVNSGEWIVQDSLHVIGSENMFWEALVLRAGTLNTNGKPIRTRRFTSYGDVKRKLVLGKTIFTISKSWEPAWYITGSNFHLDAGTSEIQIWRPDWRKVFQHDPRIPQAKYNVVKFMDLVQNTAGTDYVRINDSVSINYLYLRSYVGGLEITGANIRELYADEKVFYQNSNTTKITKATYKKDVTVMGESIYDSLILSPGSVNKFEYSKKQIINKYFGLNGDCKGLIALESTEPGKTATLHKPSDSASGKYLTIRDIIATGGAIFRGVNSVNRGNNSGWSLSPLSGKTYYWVGDSGQWSDPLHWSLISGGSSSGCVPGALDNVIFDFNSFTKSGYYVNINLGNASCNNMTWTSTVRSAIIKGPDNHRLKIHGDLRFRTNLDYQFEGIVSMEAEDTGNVIFPYYKPIRRMEFNGTGSWRLFDSLQVTGDRDCNGLFINNGHLYTQGRYMRLRRLTSEGNVIRKLTLDTTRIDLFNPCDWGWIATGTNFILSAEKSTIRIVRPDWRKCFQHTVTYPRAKFNKLHFVYKSTNTQGTDYLRLTDSISFNEITMDNIVEEMEIPSCFIGRLECKEKVKAQFGQNRYVSSNTEAKIRFAKYYNECDFYGRTQFDTLTLNPGGIYKFENGRGFTIKKLLDAVGNSCFSITIQSTNVNQQDTIGFLPSAVALIDYVEMRDQHARAFNSVKVGSFSSDVSGNTNWIFQSALNARYGLGPDTTLCLGDSLRLNTTFFKGAIGFEWSNGSKNSTLTVKKTGVYWVRVTFTYRNDTCWKYDSIDVKFTPISIGFSQKRASCDVAKDGTLKVTYQGLNPRKSWQWKHGPTLDTLSNLTKGKYIITVFDTKGCKLTDSVVLMSDTFKALPTIIDTSYCSTSLKKLILYNSDSLSYKMNWYNKTGSLIKTANNFKTPNILDSLDYQRAFVNNQGCIGPKNSVSILGKVFGDSISIAEYKATCSTSKNGALKAIYRGKSIITWSWNNGNKTDSIAQLLPGKYYVTATNTQGCDLIDSGTVGYDIVANPRGIDTAVCFFDSAIIAHTPVPGNKLYWYNGNFNLIDSNHLRHSFVDKDSIVYWVQLVSNNGCKSALVKNKIRGIKLPPSPGFINPLFLCQNINSDTLKATGNRIMWYSSASRKNPSTNAPTPSTKSIGKQVFYLTQSVGACTSLIDSIIVDVSTSKIITLGDTTIYEGTKATLMGSGTSKIKWYPSKLVEDSTAFSTTTKPSKRTCYIAEGFSNVGCRSRDTMCIDVINALTFELPNLITPNSDSQNDYWDASILPDYYKFTLYIYDRQGKLILDLPKYKNNFYGLDTEGNDLPNGIYFYRFVYPENDMEFKGYIQIIRYF